MRPDLFVDKWISYLKNVKPNALRDARYLAYCLRYSDKDGNNPYLTPELLKAMEADFAQLKFTDNPFPERSVIF